MSPKQLKCRRKDGMVCKVVLDMVRMTEMIFGMVSRRSGWSVTMRVPNGWKGVRHVQMWYLCDERLG